MLCESARLSVGYKERKFEYEQVFQLPQQGHLLQGMKAEDAIARMEGTTCGPRPTSCPDQIAQNLKRALAEL